MTIYSYKPKFNFNYESSRIALLGVTLFFLGIACLVFERNNDIAMASIITACVFAGIAMLAFVSSRRPFAFELINDNGNAFLSYNGNVFKIIKKETSIKEYIISMATYYRCIIACNGTERSVYFYNISDAIEFKEAIRSTLLTTRKPTNNGTFDAKTKK